ncbi:MAG: hypothetical protein ACPG5M_00010 [Winogradskyella sp.]
MKVSLDINKFLVLALAFILFVPIGTLSHEYGHVLAAKKLGYKTTLHYGSMNTVQTNFEKRIENIYNQNKLAIDSGADFKQKVEYKKGIEKLKTDRLFIRIGGPLQTLMTGVIGLTLLFFRRKSIKASGLKLVDWLAVFLSLFWLRAIFNLVTSVGSEIINPNGSYFGGDEKYIAELLNLPLGTFSLTLGVIGTLVCAFVVFKIIPNKIRFTFMLSGLVGGISGFMLWMIGIGPNLLP